MGLPRLIHPIIERRAHNDGVGDVLIDLGEQHGELPSETVAPRRRPRAFRARLVVLSAALLVGLGGAAVRPAAVGPVAIPARLGDNMFVEENRLHVVSAGAQPRSSAARTKIINTYTLPAGELLSRTTVTVTGAIFQVTSVADTVLVSFQDDIVGAEATVALVADTDRTRWRTAARLLSVSPADGLALLRENSPWYGDQRWYGLDLDSGRVRWSLEQPQPGYTTEAGYLDGFPRRLITATAAGHIQIRDTGTGALVSQGAVTVRPGWARRGLTVWPVGDLVLIGGQDGITAYEVAGLSPRWHSTVELTGHWVRGCADAICLFGYRGGIQALDPRTGKLRWAADRWTTATEAGPYLLVNGDEELAERYPLVVLDPSTGAVRGEFGPWRSAGPVRADGTVLGLRRRLGDDTVFSALLDPDRLTVRVLGTATTVSGDCQATTDVLVCRRIDAAVAIWSLTE